MSRPCLNCKNKYKACHDYCDKYLDNKKKLDEAKRAKLQEMEYQNYLHESIKRMKGGRL